MPVNPEDYNSDAISGEKLRALMQDEVYDRLKGDVPESIAVFLCSLKAQVDSIQKAISEKNLGECTADSLDSQSLKVGGTDVKTKQAAKGNPSASSGSANTFVDTITQNENGELTATRRVMKMYSGTGTNTDAPMTQKAVKDALDTKAPIASPTFTGTPAAPTASGSTDTTQIATTAFVHDAIENDLKKAADVAGMGNDDTHAYSGEAVSMAISSAVSGNVGGFLGNMTVAQMNAYTTPKMGDNAIVTDTGTITVGSEHCVITTAPSEVRWTTSGSWKISSAGYVRDTKVATTSVLGLVKTSSSSGGVGLDSNNRMVVNGWSDKQDALPVSSGKYGVNISGNADTATTAQTANYAGEAEKTSKIVGTYGQDGYRGIFAGYNSTGDNEGVVVQLADKRGRTSSATEITPQGMVTSGSVTATGGFHGNADSATTAQFAQESNRSATADVATLASSLSDSKGTPGQTGYKNIFAGYNNSTSEYGIGIAKKESGGDKATEITADGISTTGQITAGGGFVGNLTGNATSATYATYDDEGNKISSYYKGVYEMLPTISKNPLDTAASGAHQQLSPYVGGSPHSYNLNKSIYMAVLNFVAMDFGGYDFSTVDLELRSFPFGDTQANPYGKLLGSVGVIVPKGNSTITVAIPFDLSNNILENKSFYPTLFGSFGSVIFGGAINGTHFYFSTPAP